MNPTKQLYEVSCENCRFGKSKTHHDQMWCRDCQQKNHFEQFTEQPIAYEFHNFTTGHCYVDYVPRIDMDEKDGYTKTPLYK